MKKSFKKQIVFSLMIFAIFSVLVSSVVFFITDRIYRSRISVEIEDTTEFIAQSIDNFFEVPSEYLLGIKNHINQVHVLTSLQDQNCIIVDLIDFVKAFESIYLLDTNGTILNTWPHDDDYIGIDMSNHKFFIKNPSPDRVYWSDTFLSNQTGLPTVALTTKCKMGQVVAYYNLDQLDQFISIELEDDAEFIAVLDAHGTVVSHTNPIHSIITENLSNMTSVQAAIEGTPGTSEDYYKDVKGLVSIMKAERSGFFVMVFKSYELIFQTLYNVYFIFIGLISIMAVCYGIIILLILKKFLKPLENLQNTFLMVASGSYESVPQTDITEFMILTDSFATMVEKIKKREKALKSSIEDRETLLRELNHRTKNNMQLITSLIRLYYLKNPDSDPRNIMRKINSKIETISLVHEKLYRSTDLSSINFKEYLDELIPPLIKNLSLNLQPVSYELEIEDVYLLLDYAVPCGLILNEFIINTLKYAFSEGEEGFIRIKSRITEDNQIIIDYSDNGRGLPDHIDITRTETLGLSIISNIINSQLHGELKVGSGPGFSCTFRFSLDTYKKRI